MKARIKMSKEIIKSLKNVLIIAQNLNNLRLYKMGIVLMLITDDYFKEVIANIFDVCPKTIL